MKTDWDKLNGYVDGELDAAGAAEVATSVARDPDIAARVATLHRLKAAASAVSDRADAPAAPDQFAGNRSSGLLGAQSMIGTVPARG